MKCPHCSHQIIDDLVEGRGSFDVGSMYDYRCPSCRDWIPEKQWTEESADDDKLSYRPKHYEEGHDTFAWSEHKFDLKTNLNICRFNIHKYNDRDKGQDKRDFEKIIDYAQRALDLIQEDTMEVQGLE